jgi:hypothetical protein
MKTHGAVMTMVLGTALALVFAAGTAVAADNEASRQAAPSASTATFEALRNVVGPKVALVQLTDAELARIEGGRCILIYRDAMTPK